jgi:type VI secretion system secreted protein VgrG
MAQQDKFPVHLKSPEPAGPLLFERLSGSERLSEPYCLELTVVSERRDVSADQLLGQPVSVSLELPSGGRRPFHGLVARFVRTGERLDGATQAERRLYRYRLRLQPWYWFLSRAADCRIFQNKSVPEIFESVVKGHGFTDYTLSLTKTYEAREYCVQYRETDLNFLSRLLEDSGIFYFFRHEDDKHVMVLADDPSVHRAVAPYAEVKYREATGARGNLETIDSWWVENQVQPGTYSTTDFNFLEPATRLLKSATQSRSYVRSDSEMFDFPASPAVLEADAVESLAKVRLEEVQSAYERFHGGGSSCAGLRTGAKFKLTQHPDTDLQREYAIVAAEHLIVSNQYASGGGAGHEVSVAIEAIDAKTPFRPERRTRKPVIQGAQTAMVVGSAGAEIDTDAYGRVRVQFPWDRHGQSDENSSCWVRVAQVWAGKNWGAIHIPRIGQEVLVSFLEGDPDRPIITGRVYNGDAKPPYVLPAHATQSGIKSNSSTGGNGSNEIRFEDKAGSEEFYVHAQKDFKKQVENDQSITVGNNETTEVKQDRSATIDGNDTLKVLKDRNAKVTQTYTLEADQEIVLKSGESQLTMKMDGTIELKGVSITINGMQAVTAKVAQTQVALDPVNVKLAATMVDIKGQASTGVSGTMLDLKGSAMATLKGAITMIG